MWSSVAAVVITVAIAVVSHVATKKYYRLKRKAQLAVDLFSAAVKALEDDVLTVEEVKTFEELARRVVRD